MKEAPINLAQWQQQFALALVDERHVDDFTGLLNEKDSRRFETYKNNARQALLQTLITTYPMCERALGEQCFAQLASHYIHRFPLRENNLNQYGAYFADFLKSEIKANHSLKDYDYLVDVATLEWHQQHCYYAQDSANFDAQALAAVDDSRQAELVFMLRPDIVIMQSQYPLYELWLKQGDNLQTVEIPEPRSLYYVCIYRDQFRVKLESLSREQYLLLEQISRQQSLQTMIDKGIHIQALARFIQKTWICGFKHGKQQ